MIAETMPVMDGITNWFDINSHISDLVGVQLDFKNTGERSLYFKSQSSGALIDADDMPVTVYMVFKSHHYSGSGTIFDRSVNNAYNYGLGLVCQATEIGIHSCNSDGIVGPWSNDTYHVVAVTNSNMENGKTKQQLYIDGELIGTNENNYAASDYARGRYGGYMAINGIARPNFQRDSNIDIWIKYFAMGFATHAQEQIEQNSIWLMEKYLQGGD